MSSDVNSSSFVSIITTSPTARSATVATPTDAMSPPMAASTVARPHLAQTLSRLGHVRRGQQWDEDEDDDSNSLGLLPVGALADLTNNLTINCNNSTAHFFKVSPEVRRVCQASSKSGKQSRIPRLSENRENSARHGLLQHSGDPGGGDGGSAKPSLLTRNLTFGDSFGGCNDEALSPLPEFPTLPSLADDCSTTQGIPTADVEGHAAQATPVALDVEGIGDSLPRPPKDSQKRCSNDGNTDDDDNHSLETVIHHRLNSDAGPATRLSALDERRSPDDASAAMDETLGDPRNATLPEQYLLPTPGFNPRPDVIVPEGHELFDEDRESCSFALSGFEFLQKDSTLIKDVGGHDLAEGFEEQPIKGPSDGCRTMPHTRSLAESSRPNHNTERITHLSGFFDDAPPQNYDEMNVCDDDFVGEDVDLDAEELENLDKYRFIQEENMSVVSHHLTCSSHQGQWAGYSRLLPQLPSSDSCEQSSSSSSSSGGNDEASVHSKGDEGASNCDPSGLQPTVGEMASYFNLGSSRIGDSLGNDGLEGQTQQRPTFGFDEPIESPKRTFQLPLLSPDCGEDETPPDGQPEGQTRSDQRGNAAAIKDHGDDGPPILDRTVHDTLLIEDGVDADFRTIALVLQKATPGHDARHYANLVLAELFPDDKGTKRRLDAKEALAQWLPSFIEESACVDDDDTSAWSQQSRSVRDQSSVSARGVLRHSSPIKARIKVDRSRIVDPSSSFPLLSDRASLNWYSVPFGSSGEDVSVTLKHVDQGQTLPLRVRLIVRDSEEFFFKENHHLNNHAVRPHFLDVVIPVGGTRKVAITYRPSARTANPSRGKLTLKPQLQQRQGQACFKAVIPLTGYKGKPDIQAHCNGTLLRNAALSEEGWFQNRWKMSSCGRMALRLKNSGDSVGFFKLAAFRDPGLEEQVLLGTEELTFVSKEVSSSSSGQSVWSLEPGQECLLEVVRRTPTWPSKPIGSDYCFVLLSGCEWTRRAFSRGSGPSRARSGPSGPLGRLQERLLDPAFWSAGESDQSLQGRVIEDSAEDSQASQLLAKLRLAVFQVGFQDGPRFLEAAEASSRFYELMPEETMSQSRIFTSSAINRTATPISGSKVVPNPSHPAAGKGMTPVKPLMSGANDRTSSELEIMTAAKEVVPREDRRPKGSSASTRHHRTVKQPHRLAVLAKGTTTSTPARTSSRYRSSNQQMRSCGSSKSKGHHHRTGVYLDKETIYFPAVVLHGQSSSVAKVTLRNRTAAPATFKVSLVEAPFENYHRLVTVKPSFYLNIPIKYAPTAGHGSGPHRTAVHLEDVDGKIVLSAVLIGKTQ